MARIAILKACTTAVLVLLSTLVHAQQRSAVIGWLGSGTPDPARRAAFEQSLRESGVAGKLEVRFAQANLERLPALAAEIVQVKPDLIVVADAVSTAALKKVTSTIPIVMAGASDPVGLGLIQSLARPGGNITGLTSPFGDEFTGKWVELLHALRPSAKRFAVLWNPEIPAARRRNEQIRAAARNSGVHLDSLEVREARDFERAFALYKSRGAEGLIIDNAPFITAHGAEILAFVRREAVPSVSGHAPLASGGALISYGADFPDIYRKAALYAVKILDGAKPGDLAVEQPSKYELVINLAAAKSLGIQVPKTLLIRADRVISASH
jgi:putative ABC transport system substrate-binding protein